MRFQQQVALYIAAFLGHLDLASWLLQRGVHAQQPVGVHPYRQWCHETAHPDSAKCPIHAAAEQGQLLILKLFVSNNLLTLACRDPEGHNPLQIAIRHSHRECVRYLGTKLCSVVSLPHMSMPVRIYVQVKRWVKLGQKKAAAKRCQGIGASLKARVGDTVLVDGYAQPKMSSKPRRGKGKAGRAVRAKPLRPLPTIGHAPRVNHLPCKQASQGGPQCAAEDVKILKTQRHVGSNTKQKGPSTVNNDENNSSQWRSRVPLPPISRNTNPRHLQTDSFESFSRHFGRTPRENAMYCLAMASVFTERPWLQQLDMARMLARKSFQNMTYGS